MQMMIGFIRASAFLLFVVASIASIESTDGFSTSASQRSTSNPQSTTPSTTSTALHVLDTKHQTIAITSDINHGDQTASTSTSSNLTPTGADLKAWARGFQTCPNELPPTILDCDLPADFPVGTYYRNGHARFEADDGTPVLHPFDGDGMIVATTFDPHQKRILFRNKFIETKGYTEDKRTGKMSARGIFGTMKSGGMLANAFQLENKNVANTNVVHAGNALYALWEGGKPYELNPLTLENVNGPGADGETDLDGTIKGTDNFSAHLRYDPKNGVYVNFGINFDPIVGSKLTLFEVDEHTFRSTKPSTPSVIVSKGPVLIHDFILSDNYCIFNLNKCELERSIVLKALLGLTGFAGVIDIDQDATETSIVMIPRSLFDETEGVTDIDFLEDDRIIVVPVQNHFNFHFGNCFEDENGNVVFDTVQTAEISLDGMTNMKQPIWELPRPFDLVTPNTLVRYTLDVQNRCLAEAPKTLSTRIPEFPSLPKEMSTRKHRYLYPVASHIQVEFDLNTKGSGPAGALQKVDTEHPELSETYAFEPYEFPGEAVFAAKAGKDVTQQEDAGYLIVHIVNGKDRTTDFAIFDVEGKGSFEKGPVVRQRLPVFLPHMLHGNFFDGVTFDFDSFATK